MLKKEIQRALNNQVNAEMWSANIYLSMSAYFESVGMSGFANWMFIQYQEELSHSMKLFKYIVERGGRAKVKPIDAVETEWNSAIHAMKDTLKHEEEVTELINNLVDLAITEKDHATVNMLQWFVEEQVEEEANVSEIIDQLKMVDGKGHGLLMLDRELKARVFVDSTKL